MFLQEKNVSLESELADVNQKLLVSNSKIQELEEIVLTKCDHENISIMKLNADITSDKVAAQKATEQNLKLKQDIQDLEGAYVKMVSSRYDMFNVPCEAQKSSNQEVGICQPGFELGYCRFPIKE